MAGFRVVAVSHREGLRPNISRRAEKRFLIPTTMGREFPTGGDTPVRALRRRAAHLSKDRNAVERRRMRTPRRRPSREPFVAQPINGECHPKRLGPVAPAPNLLVTAALWLLMLLSATLPFFIGGVSGMGDLWFNTLGWCAVALWVGGLYQQRRFPSVSLWVAAPLGMVFLVGALATLNAEFAFDGPFSGFTASVAKGWLPSSVDAGASLSALRHWALLGALFSMSSDFCAERTHCDLYRNCLTVAGFVQIGVALGQRLSDARSILGGGWGEQLPFFGTFIYPGSAGAYLNLLLPLFCLHFFAKTQRPFVGIAGLAGLGVAVFWNTSRLSSLVGVCTGTLLLLTLGTVAWQKAEKEKVRAALFLSRHAWRPVLVSAILVGGLALMVFPVPPLFEKWRLLPTQWNTAYPRFEAMKACWEICRDAGAWGFGLGTFASVFPHYSHEMAVSARGVWRHAHCDYLEWFIEWGYLGCLLWSFLPLGALVRVCGRYFQEKSAHRRSEAACTGAALLALGLHALGDFPVFNPGVQVLAVFWLGNAWSARVPSTGPDLRKAQGKRKGSLKEAVLINCRFTSIRTPV